MSALDDKFGEGTQAALAEEFCPDGWSLVVESEGDEEIRITFTWSREDEPAAVGEIVWRWAENSIMFTKLVVEESFRGQGFYKWIAGKSAWFDAKGVRTFLALAPPEATFLPSGGPWEPHRGTSWRWRL